MNYGIYLPNFGAAISAQSLADLAAEAESSGWDGFFIWDHILYGMSQRSPMVDPWVALAGIAMSTRRIRIGTSVTPVARRRPWKLARETITLDHLSKGRLTLAVGLGEPPGAEFAHFGEDPDPKIRAAKLDEGLEILVGLWSGKPFSFQGEQYQIEKTVFRPAAYQSPRIPIWVGGFWPNKGPFRRAARWDGAFPLKKGGRMTGKVLRDVKSYIQRHRLTDEDFDLVVMGSTSGDNRERATTILRPLRSAGLTWWLESLFRAKHSYEGMAKRIRQGPPRQPGPHQEG